MSIVPASCLSRSELALLGHNLLGAAAAARDHRPSRVRRRNRRLVGAVNRSLAGLGERVAKLYRPTLAAS